MNIDVTKLQNSNDNPEFLDSETHTEYSVTIVLTTQKNPILSNKFRIFALKNA